MVNPESKITQVLTAEWLDLTFAEDNLAHTQANVLYNFTVSNLIELKLVGSGITVLLNVHSASQNIKLMSVR